MSRYRAKYNNLGEKVYEAIDGIVTVDRQSYGREASYYVMPDIQAYQAMGGDVAMGGKAPVIQSRSQHRQYLKRNGYIEVGNEPMREQQRNNYNPEEVKREIAKHLYR